MATSVVTVTLRNPGVSSEGRFFVAEYNVSIAAGDYPAGGIPVDFTTPGIAALNTPTVAFQPSSVNGFVFAYVSNTTMANGKIFIRDDALAQHATAALGAAMVTSFRATLRVPKYGRG